MAAAATTGVSASTGKLVLAGLAALGLGATVYRGVSRQERRKRLTTKPASLTKTKYPVTPKEPEVTDFHGTKVTDNYRWLEDPDSDLTKAWVNAQKEVTDAYLDTLKSQRATIAARLKETFNYERYGVPFKRGTRVFYYKNDGLQNQSVLYWYDEKDQTAAANGGSAADAAAGASDTKGPAREAARVKVKVLLDPNTLEKDGTASLGSTALTDSGELFAYGVARSGSDWNTIHVRRVSDGHDFADKLEWVKFSSIAWTTDEKGFFYSRYPQPKQFAAGDANFARGTETDANLNQAVYYHRLGTEQRADKLIWANPNDPKWMTSAAVTDDGDYVLLYINDSCDPVNRLFYAKTADLRLNDPAYDARGAVVKLVDDFKAEYSAVHNTGSVFYFKTNLNASNNKLIAIDLTKPDPSHWHEIIAQTADVMDSIQVVDGDKFVAVYMQHAKEVPRVFDLKGQPLDRLQFGLPAPGSVAVAGSVTSADVFYKFTSVLFPGTIFRLNVRTGVVTIWGEIVVKGFDPTLFDTKQIFYYSKDGTRVPMLITHRKSVQLDGSNPTILYGYGGFNISLPPAFSMSVLLWLNHFDGVYAVPNIRGGGEYGEEWHKAGSLQKKQNCFDDFIAAAQWLIDHKYTQSARLAINGASNGGLLVAACANQRPDLFAAAVPQVGVLDMLRFHRWTIGYAWCSDYGNADAKKEDFEALYKYSPFHTVQNVDTEYPATLVMTADHDDRVVPAHSFKFTAALQEAVGERDTQCQPVLIRIETKAGHGAGKPLAKVIEEYADYYAFVAKHVGAQWHD